jgi:flagellar basal body rod protein FlgG
MTIPLRPSGLTSTASALQMLERKQAVLANNLANASTRGFKAEHPFARLLDNARAVTETTLDTTAGTITNTGNPLDLAIEGEGFFVTQTPGGERFVRTGSFQLDAERRLVDGRGNPVLGEQGPVVLRPGVVTIDADGMVQLNGRPVPRLGLERVDAAAELQHEGGTQFVPDDTRRLVPAAERRVRQGALEESNVNPMLAMTDMLDLLGQFQAAQKVLTAIDEARGIAVTDLAKPV